MDTAILDKTITKAYATDVAIPNSHNHHSAIHKQLQKYEDLKEVLKRMWQLKTACVIPLALPETGIIPNKLHKNLELLNLHCVLYILMQKVVTLNTRHIVGTFLAEQ